MTHQKKNNSNEIIERKLSLGFCYYFYNHYRTFKLELKKICQYIIEQLRRVIVDSQGRALIQSLFTGKYQISISFLDKNHNSTYNSLSDKSSFRI